MKTFGWSVLVSLVLYQLTWSYFDVPTCEIRNEVNALGVKEQLPWENE